MKDTTEISNLIYTTSKSVLMFQPNFVAGYIVDPKAPDGPLYLLLRREQNDYLPGIWQIVTGQLLENEDASIAVQREIFEETGLRCKEFYNVDVTMFYDRAKKRIAFSANFCTFVKHAQSITLSSTEHDAFKWCTFAESLSLLAFPSQKETLAFIHKHYVLEKPHVANVFQIGACE